MELDHTDVGGSMLRPSGIAKDEVAIGTMKGQVQTMRVFMASCRISQTVRVGTALLALAGAACSDSADESARGIRAVKPLPEAQKVFENASAVVFTVRSYAVNHTIAGDPLGGEVQVISSRAEVPAATGSGVAVGVSQIVTNCHVVLGGHEVVVESVDGGLFEVDGVAADLERDLCLLSVKGGNFKTAAKRSAESLRVGEPVFSIGAAAGLSHSIAQGVISGLRRNQDSIAIQSTAAISPGSSGGGLFDSFGQLVGITTFRIDGEGQIGFALPTEWVSEIRKRSEELLAKENALASKYGASCLAAAKRRVGCDLPLPLESCDEKATVVFGPEHQFAGAMWAKQNPLSPAAWTCLAFEHHDARRYADATAAIERALALRPLPSALVDAGRMYRDLGAEFDALDPGAAGAAYGKSLEYLVRATVVDPRSAEAWAELGLLHLSMDNMVQAELAARTALQLDDESQLASAVLRMIELGM